MKRAKQAPRIYDVGGKLSDGIKSMHVNSLVCIRAKEGETKVFKIDSGVKWFFSVYMNWDNENKANGDCLPTCM